jgi:serine/threonine protein kinase
MRVCSACGNSYPDDANFCPMDATRLPPAVVAEAPATIPSMPATGGPAVTQPDQPTPIGGRFVLAGVGMQTPTGLASAATDTQNGSTVVVKMVAAEVLPTTAMADRALRELKQLGKVTSDRIVRVVDQGRLPDGRVFVATERVDGAATLEELVGREGPLPLDRAKAIVLQVGEALTEAQKVGVIHRDVAPRNVLIGASDKVKVGDFGLAEAVTDRVFGAPGFLSPEQAEGKPVDQRSNIYSLGAVYYFALTGKAPFAGDAASLLQQHLSAVPQPPSALRAGLGADVDRVIGKALEKSGGRRHLTLRQLLTEVAGTSTGPAAQPLRSGAEAKTVMGLEAPQMPPKPQPATVPSRVQPPAPTNPGPTSPVGSMGPGSTAPSMPVVTPPHAAPPHAAPPQAVSPQAAPRQAAPPQVAPPQAAPPQAAPPQAATVMAEAPAPRAQPAAPQPIPAQPTPQPATPRQQAPAQAPTMMAEAPRAAAPTNHAPPVAAPAVPLGAKPNNQTGKKGAFRETAWFKRGEIEEEMAKAQAATGDNALKSGITGQHLPVDESQVDLSAQDRDRLSLKTGATQAMPVIKAPVQALPGDRMDEAEMLAELNPSKKYFIIAGAALLAIVLGLVIYFATRASPKAEAPAPEKPAPVAAAPPATPPAPSPPATAAVVAPTPPATKPPTPAPPAAKPPVAPPPPSPSVYATQVAKLEASGGEKRDIKRLEKLVSVELKVAHKKRERNVEEADHELLARLKKLRAK